MGCRCVLVCVTSSYDISWPEFFSVSNCDLNICSTCLSLILDVKLMSFHVIYIFLLLFLFRNTAFSLDFFERRQLIWHYIWTGRIRCGKFLRKGQITIHNIEILFHDFFFSLGLTSTCVYSSTQTLLLFPLTG